LGLPYRLPLNQELKTDLAQQFRIPDIPSAWGGSTPEGPTPPVLVPGSHEQPHQGDRNQTEHDAAKQWFDHGARKGLGTLHNLSIASPVLATIRHEP
jgi:hypothetical protein